MALRPDALVFDTRDPMVEAIFWAGALGFDVDPDSDATDAHISDPSARTSGAFFQQVPEPKVVKNRIHLDLRVGGGLEVPVALRKQRVEAEVDRLIGAGATRLRTFDEVVADRYFVVMQDPEGNEFCLS